MAWNQSTGEAAKPQPKKPGALRGVIAGVVCACLAATVAFFVLSGKDEKPKAKVEKEAGLIKEVKPAVASAKAEGPAAAKAIKIKGTNDVRYASAKPRKYVSPAHERLIEQQQNGARPYFKHISENILAMYAVPGQPVPPMPLTKSVLQDFMNSLVDKIEISEDDTEEDIRLKESVAGMKEEVVAWVKDGGDIKGYLAELAKRQQKEVEYRQAAQSMVVKAIREGRSEEAYESWKAFNGHLREKGTVI